MIASPGVQETVLDPYEAFKDAMACAWRSLSETFDVSRGFPETNDLFRHVEFGDAEQAAQMILVNMLLEVMERVCRFSPWYTRPARAFGLAAMGDPTPGRPHWTLAPEAAYRWREELAGLQAAIQRSSGLLQAILLVDRLMECDEAEEDFVTVSCACTPRRSIHIKQSIKCQAELICAECKQPFS